MLKKKEAHLMMSFPFFISKVDFELMLSNLTTGSKEKGLGSESK